MSIANERMISPTLSNQTVEYVMPDYDGKERTYLEIHTVRDVEIDEPDQLGNDPIFDTTVTGVVTWQGEHKVVEKHFRGWSPVTLVTLQRDTRAWSFTGDVVGYEPGVS